MTIGRELCAILRREEGKRERDRRREMEERLIYLAGVSRFVVVVVGAVAGGDAGCMAVG